MAVRVQQAAFDPVLQQSSTWTRSENPQATFDPNDPSRVVFTGLRVDSYQNNFAVSKTNVLGGQWTLNWIENPTRFNGPGLFPLNPQNRDSVELNYTQPLLQGAGFYVNTAPIVIAQINTERSYFQFKDSVQESVRGVIEAYWNLVFARTDLAEVHSNLVVTLEWTYLVSRYGATDDISLVRINPVTGEASAIVPEYTGSTDVGLSLSGNTLMAVNPEGSMTFIDLDQGTVLMDAPMMGKEGTPFTAYPMQLWGQTPVTLAEDGEVFFVREEPNQP